MLQGGYSQAFELFRLGSGSRLLKTFKQSENLLSTYYVLGIILAKRGKNLITKSLTSGKPWQGLDEKDKKENKKMMSVVNPVKEIIRVLIQKTRDSTLNRVA